MELCRRAIEFIQVINEEGDVRICGWLKDGGIIGRLTDNTMEEIYHSAEADMIRSYHANKIIPIAIPMPVRMWRITPWKRILSGWTRFPNCLRHYILLMKMYVITVV